MTIDSFLICPKDFTAFQKDSTKFEVMRKILLIFFKCAGYIQFQTFHFLM